jgi:serine/threonine protein kinase/Tol biopolymer transport system component
MTSALHSGNSISHYRIISPLGEGGMGEVYLARDETLERSVALKVLPPELIKNEERLRRFVQEAKSASSLSHPHIVTIYEIGEAEVRPGDDGEPSGASIHFIAMELISGATLKEKIHGEKTDLRTLLRYLAQAAEGLAKAHSAGIVHRDLKPENIMISRDGYAKVLDFGLAKLTERREGSDGATSAPTKTREGSLLGTVGYMSPEQVRGKTVDHRSDVFSFGCILYEAATGHRPFVADSEVETMHRILNDHPEPVETLNPQAPNALRRLIRRCLAKQPDQRLHSMKDLALQLTDIVDEYEKLPTASDSRGSSPDISGPVPAPRTRWGTGAKAGVVAGVVVGIAVIAFGIHGLWRRQAAPGGEIAPFQSMKMTRLTGSGNVMRGAISPDGKYAVHSVTEPSGNSLWVRQVATGSDVRIVSPLPTPFRGLSFSPDGNYVYYVNQETSGPGYSYLYQVPVLGGPTRKLLFDVDTAVGFSPDGRQLAFIRGYPQQSEAALMIANADGTAERKLAVRKDPESFTFQAPSWSPDGGRIAAVVFTPEGGVEARVATVDVADGRPRLLGDRTWGSVEGLAWLPDGSGLVLAASERKGAFSHQVWFLSYPEGRALRISNDLNDYRGIGITADGKTLATTQVHWLSNLWVAPAADPAAAEQVTSGTSLEDSLGRVRAAGARAVVFEGMQGDAVHLWRMGIDGTNRVRLTSDPALHVDPDVSRDGRIIAFLSFREDGLPHVWTMDSDGGNLVQATDGQEGEQRPALSPDGGLLLYGSLGDLGLYEVSSTGGTPRKLADDFNGDAVFSPDGERIAYECFVEEGGRLRRSVKVIPAEGGSPLVTLPWSEGLNMRWVPGANALSYVRSTGGHQRHRPDPRLPLIPGDGRTVAQSDVRSARAAFAPSPSVSSNSFA